jgi:hypothetical protein
MHEHRTNARGARNSVTDPSAFERASRLAAANADRVKVCVPTIRTDSLHNVADRRTIWLHLAYSCCALCMVMLERQ